MKQSCPSLALIELLLNTHLLEASATDTRLVDFASVVCVFILFFDTGTRELSEMDPSLKMRSKKLLLTFTGFWGGKDLSYEVNFYCMFVRMSDGV